MNTENRIKDLYEKQHHICIEYNKINKHLNKVVKKSENAVITLAKLNESDLLKNFTNTYKYLNKLHVKLMDISCVFELFFLDFEKYENDHNILNNSPSKMLDDIQFNKKSLNITSFENFHIADDSIKEQNLDPVHAYNKNLNENFLGIKAENNIQHEYTGSTIQTTKSLISKIKQNESNQCSPQIPNCNFENIQRKVLTKNCKYIPDKIYNANIKNEHIGNNKSNQENKYLSMVSSSDPKEGDICYVSFVQSPSLFYIQVVRDETTLIDSISDQIENSLENLCYFNSKKDAMKVINPYCVCYCEKSNAWHRGEVIDWLNDRDDLVLVQLVDYGCTIDVPLYYLRETLSMLCYLPKMADTCHLAWVRSPDDKSNSIDWPEDSVKYFHDIVDPSANRLFTISFVERTGCSLMIDLQSNLIPSLVGDMICSGKAKAILPEIDDVETNNTFINNETKTDSAQCNHGNVNNADDNCGTDVNPAVNKDIFDDIMKEQIRKSQGFSKEELYLDENETLEKEFEMNDIDENEDPNLAVSHYNPIDERRACKFLYMKDGCFKGSNCNFSHEPLNPDGWTTDRELVYHTAFNNIQLPCMGTTVSVKVISISDLRTIYVSLKMPSDMNYLYLQPVTSMKELVNMMNHRDEIRTFKTPVVIPCLSQIILARYNDTWQRARVMEIIEHCDYVNLNVFLVDFGDVITVNMKNTREIKHKYLHLPFQAVMCMLCNVSLKPNLKPEQLQMGIDYLERCALHKTLSAKIIYASIHLNILLYDENGQDIGKQLTEAGLVEECKEMVIPLNNCNLLID